VARTISDIDGEVSISGRALAESIEYKKDCIGVMPEV
jgi:predicted ATPase with chaperone activity